MFVTDGMVREHSEEEHSSCSTVSGAQCGLGYWPVIPLHQPQEGLVFPRTGGGVGWMGEVGSGAGEQDLPASGVHSGQEFIQSRNSPACSGFSEEQTHITASRSRENPDLLV